MPELLRFIFVLDYQEIWQSLDAAFPIDTCQGAFSFSNDFLASQHAVLVIDSRTTGSHRSDLKSQRVAKPAGTQVMNVHFIHDEQKSIAFEVGVVAALGEQLLDPRQLEILQVVRVMDETLGIGFVVANANFNLVIGQHGTVNRLLDDNGWAAYLLYHMARPPG